jgi:GT2 family glycosyltransferase
LWGLRPLVEYNGKPAEVEAVMGSVLMVKRSVFEEIGLFDERYFMFAEDVDLCWSIQKHGYSIYYVREGSIIHHGGKSSDFQEETHFSAILQRESVTLFLAKTRGKFYAWLYKYAMGVSALGRLLLITTLIPFRTGEVNQRRLKLASRKSKKLLRWSLGLESITPNADSTLTAKPDNC